MPTDLTTANRGYPLPHADNDLAHDVARIIAALQAVDVDMAQALVVAGVYATLADPAFTGTPTAPTAAPGTSTTQLATTAFVHAALNALIAAAPGALDTLNELAAALGDDPDFAATIAAQIAGKADAAHVHDDRYYTEAEADAALGAKSDTGHSHDDRYYTESEIDALLGGGYSHDISLLYLYTSDLSGRALGMVDGVVDAFDNFGDVTVLNGFSTGGRIEPRASLIQSMYDYAVGGVTVLASSEADNREAWKAFAASNSGYWEGDVAPGTTPQWLQVDLGTAKTALRYDLRLGGGGNERPVDWKLQGSNNGTGWTDLDVEADYSWSHSSSSVANIFEIDTPAAYRYYRLYVTETHVANWPVRIGELALHDDASADPITATSRSFVADAQPDTARCGVMLAGAAGVSINTDVTMEVSRDGGTTWSLANLVEVGTLAGSGERYFEDGQVDLTVQPEGTSMVYRITADGEDPDLRVTGALLQWNQE